MNCVQLRTENEFLKDNSSYYQKLQKERSENAKLNTAYSELKNRNQLLQVSCDRFDQCCIDLDNENRQLKSQLEDEFGSTALKGIVVKMWRDSTELEARCKHLLQICATKDYEDKLGDKFKSIFRFMGIYVFANELRLDWNAEKLPLQFLRWWDEDVKAFVSFRNKIFHENLFLQNMQEGERIQKANDIYAVRNKLDALLKRLEIDVTQGGVLESIDSLLRQKYPQDMMENRVAFLSNNI